MFQLDFQLLQVTIECPRRGTGQQKICILIDEESITCHKRRYIVLPMKANNTIWSNITLQKSCKKVRAHQEAFLHISCVFLFIFVGFHVTLKRNYCLYFLKVIINVQQLQPASMKDFLLPILVLPSILQQNYTQYKRSKQKVLLFVGATLHIILRSASYKFQKKWRP